MRIKTFESFLGLKKAFSFDTTYDSIQDIWNHINDYVMKKNNKLKNINGSAGFTNGVTEFTVSLSNYNYVKKTVDINGIKVDFDNVLKYTESLLKKNHLL